MYAFRLSFSLSLTCHLHNLCCFTKVNDVDVFCHIDAPFAKLYKNCSTKIGHYIHVKLAFFRSDLKEKDKEIRSIFSLTEATMFTHACAIHLKYEALRVINCIVP